MRRFYGCVLIYLLLISSVFAKNHTKKGIVAESAVLQPIQSKLIRLPRSIPDPLNEVLPKMSIWGYDTAQFAVKSLGKNQQHTSVSEFSSEYVENQGMLMPARPKGVSKREWRAFNLFFKSLNVKELASENQRYQFALVDLDDDGLRDLIVSYYVGGTGLFAQFEVYKHYLKDGFKTTSINQEGASAAWQSISGRPIYQKFFLIKIHGKTYVAYIEHDYSTQVLTLYRTLAKNTPQQQLLLEYAHEYELAPQWGFESSYTDDQNPQKSAKTFESWAKQNQGLVEAINHRLTVLVREKIEGRKSTVAACPYVPNKDMETNDRALDEKLVEQPENWGAALHYTMLKGDAFWIRTTQQCLYAEIVCLGNADNCELNLYEKPGELYQSLGLRHKRVYRTGEKLIDATLSLTP